MREPGREERFDRELMEMLPEELPEDVSRAVNPWHKPMTRIVWGLGLTSILLRFFNLDVFLPAAGWVLLLLGFRVLRKENRWLGICWLTSLAGTGFALFQMVLDSAVWAEAVRSAAVFLWIQRIMLFSQPVLDISLWLGLRAVRKQAGLAPGAGAALALFFWHMAIIGIGLARPEIRANFLFLLLLAANIGILVSIHKISRTLDLAGYGLKSTAVRISDGALSAVLAGAAAAGILCGLLFFQQYPMHWTPVREEEAPQTEQVRTELLALGFPETVLRDLTEQDVLALQGAVRVVSGSDVHPMTAGRREMTREPGVGLVEKIIYDKKELRITGVAVLLPGGQERWQIIHHFCWEEQPKFFGTESIGIIPTDHINAGWMCRGELSGRLLCQQDGQTMEAPFWFLGDRAVRGTSFTGEASVQTNIIGAFSLPRKAQRQRGYVSYCAEELTDGCIIDSWFDYTHRDSPFLYPNRSAMDHKISGIWDLKNRFPEVQTSVQFYPFREGDVLFGYEDSRS